MIEDVHAIQSLAFSLKETEVHDSRVAISLVKKRGKKLQGVLADKGHDTHRMLSGLKERKVASGIIPKKGSKTRGDTNKR